MQQERTMPLSDGKIMSEYTLNRSRSADILDSRSLFAFPLSKTYSVADMTDYSADYTQNHGLRSHRSVQPVAYPSYRSYFPFKRYQSSYLSSLYWNDKSNYYSNAHNRVLQPRHLTDHMRSPYFMNYSCTFYPNKYTYNDAWYGYKSPSYYRNFYYVSPYYDYYANQIGRAHV